MTSSRSCRLIMNTSECMTCWATFSAVTGRKVPAPTWRTHCDQRMPLCLRACTRSGVKWRPAVGAATLPTASLEAYTGWYAALSASCGARRMWGGSGTEPSCPKTVCAAACESLHHRRNVASTPSASPSSRHTECRRSTVMLSLTPSASRLPARTESRRPGASTARRTMQRQVWPSQARASMVAGSVSQGSGDRNITSIGSELSWSASCAKMRAAKTWDALQTRWASDGSRLGRSTNDPAKRSRGAGDAPGCSCACGSAGSGSATSRRDAPRGDAGKSAMKLSGSS
mmetsp:Transcript_19917/g.54813  ORF Transcript_19917/g.54813 Transcript_19917/m.54813 type:complete len:286 (-) Transcript_19917:376-1233(-)